MAAQSTTRPSYTPFPAPLDVLPFVKGKGKKRNNWAVEPTDDYGLSCRKGREYAAHFVQYLQDNPEWAGSNMLSFIAQDMDFEDESSTKGYYVGFFSFLEMLLWNFANEHDAWRYYESVEARYSKVLAARDAEEAEEDAA